MTLCFERLAKKLAEKNIGRSVVEHYYQKEGKVTILRSYNSKSYNAKREKGSNPKDSERNHKTRRREKKTLFQNDLQLSILFWLLAALCG